MPLPIRFMSRVALAAAVLLLLAAPALAARVATLSGQVERADGQSTGSAGSADWQPVAAGDTLAAGEQVRTGEDGRAEIVLARATIRLYPNSLLRIPAEPAADHAVELERGTSLFDVLKGDEPFDVRTPDVVVSVKGTRFSVALGSEGASVAVFRGAVGVRSLALEAAREVLVREGFVASGAERLDLRVLDLQDPWDAFSSGVLLDLPTSDLPASQARMATLDAARSAALDAAAPDAVDRASARHPEVRARVEKLRRERAAVADRDAVQSLGPPAHAGGPDRRNGRLSKRDGVADAPAALAGKLEESFVEAWMNGGMPSPPGEGGAGMFDVTFVSGQGVPGPDHVRIEVDSGQAWQFNHGNLQAVVAGGQSLPAPLETLLVARGIEDPAFFAQQLLMLFEN